MALAGEGPMLSEGLLKAARLTERKGGHGNKQFENQEATLQLNPRFHLVVCFPHQNLPFPNEILSL